MKRTILINSLLILFLFPASLFSQDLNWKNVRDDYRHFINLNAGLDYGLSYGARYGYRPAPASPLLLVLDISLPSGKNYLDDFKTKIGGYIQLISYGSFQLSGKIEGIFRRHENSYARLLNFGSDIGLTAGYYSPKWFVAGEAGFDKAIVTHFKHSPEYRKNFPQVQDGWYEPSTGGNFYYGMKTGFSFKQNELYLKAGKLRSQDLSSKPLLPVYLQLGYNRWLKS